MDDTITTRIPPSCPEPVADILRRAWHHDLPGLKPLVSASAGRASVQEPTTGETPLHAAIRGCAEPVSSASSSLSPEDREAAAATVIRELFLSGAIWNDVDAQNETPGCLARRLGLDTLYDLCVGAGVRAELLFGLMEGYEELSSAGDEEEEEEKEENNNQAENADAEQEKEAADDDDPDRASKRQRQGQEVQEIEIQLPSDRSFIPPDALSKAGGGNPDVTSDAYLSSNLTLDDGKLVDADKNGVMMAWETSIMRASVDALLPPTNTNTNTEEEQQQKQEEEKSGDKEEEEEEEKIPAPRILNLGFGMGIIDSMFRDHSPKPSRHHIIEAHPDVLARLASAPGEKDFGPAWEATSPPSASGGDGAYKIHAGRWQDVVPKLIEAGEQYDAIYFDTFGEDYSQLRNFFTEYVPELLDQMSPQPGGARFSFFNGLGADRQVCYDVYTKVVEMHLSDVGMDVEWEELDVDMEGLGEEGKGQWEGVKRRYWTLNKYRLPICTFMA